MANLSNEYILYACPRGPLVDDLNAFWNACSGDDDLKNEAVTVYPPHITLTDFFEQRMEESAYIEHLKEVLTEIQEQPDFTLGQGRLVKRPLPRCLHAVYFNSSLLSKIAQNFIEKANVPAEKSKINAERPECHLTLANHFKPEVADKISTLEDAIDFKKEHRTSICLFKCTRVDGSRKLDLVFEQNIS